MTRLFLRNFSCLHSIVVVVVDVWKRVEDCFIVVEERSAEEDVLSFVRKKKRKSKDPFATNLPISDAFSSHSFFIQFTPQTFLLSAGPTPPILSYQTFKQHLSSPVSLSSLRAHHPLF